MFIQLRKITVTEGNAEKVIERFSKEGLIEKQEGFIDSIVMEKKRQRGNEEVVVMIRWESEEHWKQWEKSDVHIAGHKAKRGQPKPEYIVDMEVTSYIVKKVKESAATK